MSATLMLGNQIAKQTYAYVQNKINALIKKHIHPSIAAILVGDDPGSIAYLGIKEKKCRECDIKFNLAKFPNAVSESDLITYIEQLNKSSDITGIIIQLPLPRSLDRDKILLSVDEKKDIDAFTFSLNDQSSIGIRPPAPAGMIEILDQYQIDLVGKNVVIIGDGLLVGQPLHKMLSEININATIIADQSANSLSILKNADVVFSGVGKANLIMPNMLKRGVVVVDAGYAKVNGVTCGDCDPKCAEVVSWMTPPIGGIGPLTVANLLKNVVDIIEE